jgi:NADPH:quinone reductase-like Zn-dependent oxidoreductase
MPTETMHAIVIKKYGDVDHLVAEDVPKPGPPEGEDLLVK